ncbi:hypothetical protein Aph01nite_49520 [Acrocarpospora phusangensis]|uniref:Uncharacterized protein n=1 Tax=Acrocarpospora phusangensis TaxID=1070424 RepID=A0A919UQA8_9ACTN|nr:hypothetical protein Aph01nite_49520 [Acrocarpospora phusangensis]
MRDGEGDLGAGVQQREGEAGGGHEQADHVPRAAHVDQSADDGARGHVDEVALLDRADAVPVAQDGGRGGEQQGRHADGPGRESHLTSRNACPGHRVSRYLPEYMGQCPGRCAVPGALTLVG